MGPAVPQGGRYRTSRQRERILELLRSTGTHPTATWLYDRLKEEFPGLSMGTIYRNLHILQEQGLAGRIDFGSTFDRFDANMEPHYHFVCERCGAIVDLDLPPEDELETRVERRTGFQVSRHRVEFYGVCAACLRKEQGEER